MKRSLSVETVINQTFDKEVTIHEENLIHRKHAMQSLHRLVTEKKNKTFLFEVVFLCDITRVGSSSMHMRTQEEKRPSFPQHRTKRGKKN